MPVFCSLHICLETPKWTDIAQYGLDLCSGIGGNSALTSVNILLAINIVELGCVTC